MSREEREAIAAGELKPPRFTISAELTPMEVAMMDAEYEVRFAEARRARVTAPDEFTTVQRLRESREHFRRVSCLFAGLFVLSMMAHLLRSL